MGRLGGQGGGLAGGGSVPLPHLRGAHLLAPLVSLATRVRTRPVGLVSRSQHAADIAGVSVQDVFHRGGAPGSPALRGSVFAGKLLRLPWARRLAWEQSRSGALRLSGESCSGFPR